MRILYVLAALTCACLLPLAAEARGGVFIGAYGAPGYYPYPYPYYPYAYYPPPPAYYPPPPRYAPPPPYAYYPYPAPPAVVGGAVGIHIH